MLLGMARLILVGVLVLAAAACQSTHVDPKDSGPGPEISLTSPAFPDGETVPDQFTCTGADESPPLKWSGVPAEAESLTLSLTDADAPGGPFTHWMVTGIDPSSTGVTQGEMPTGGTEQQNSFGETSYGGPCPPPGELHVYTWEIEAVSEDGDVIGSGSLTAEFGR
jgi:Raf kinase inhibitor-like YbhB/YbcL family protein